MRVLAGGPEEWRPVDGWPYEVSSEGRVRRSERPQTGSTVGRIVQQRVARGKGYREVHLRDRQRSKWPRVHRLAAAAFLGPCPTGQQVNHIDGNKANNRPENLEYVTPRQNMRHASRHRLLSHGERHPDARLTEEAVRAIRAAWDDGVLIASIAAEWGITKGYAWKVANRWNWRHVA